MKTFRLLLALALCCAATGPLCADQHDYMSRIYDSGNYLLKLLNDVLDDAKLEAGRIDLQCEPTSLEPVALDALMTTSSLALGKAIELRQEIAADLPVVYIDRMRVAQVLLNLLSNAVKYSPSGGDVSLALQFEKNEFSIQVRDQGVGIPEADLEHLFDLFHRGQNADIAPGAGLGMVIVKHAVEAHGGTIQVNSKVGSGTAFTISLPC